jgi:hypothetical protein
MHLQPMHSYYFVVFEILFYFDPRSLQYMLMFLLHVN